MRKPSPSQRRRAAMMRNQGKVWSESRYQNTARHAALSIAMHLIHTLATRCAETGLPSCMWPEHGKAIRSEFRIAARHQGIF